MWANIPGLILLSGGFVGDLTISNPGLHSANNHEKGMTEPLLVTHKTVEPWTAKTVEPPANIGPHSTQQSDLYWNLSFLVESL